MKVHLLSIMSEKYSCGSSSNIKLLHLMLVLIIVITIPTSGQATQGFISIDCGYPTNSSYIDPITNLTYISDDEYVGTGTSYTINSNYNNNINKQALYLRSFPNGDRNCYTLPVKQYSKYLVRAVFMYGNYDGLDSANPYKPLQFDVYIDVNYWRTVSIKNASHVYNPEVVVVSFADSLSVCLINTNNGTPFISALELRPLVDSMYKYANITQYLAFSVRRNAGEITKDVVRYPDDPYDRRWVSWNYLSPISAQTTPTSVERFDNDQWQAPIAVLKTAIQPINSSTISFYVTFQDTGLPNNQFYYVLHFMEFQLNNHRNFSLYRNDNVSFRDYTPPYLGAGFIYSESPMSSSPEYDWALNSSGLSVLPPILNAVELYSPMYLTNLATNSTDSDAINAIKLQYQVKKNWVGDPCSPQEFAWNGLSCSYGSIAPKITSVNLSSSSLSGVISSNFSDLTALEYLDLSYNNLTGDIPSLLGTLSSLKVLDLNFNNLSGPIPDTLLKKSNAGLLTLCFNNSMNRCVPVSQQTSKKKKISTPIIVVLSVVPALLLLLLVTFIVSRIRRRKDMATNSQPTGMVTPPLIPSHSSNPHIERPRSHLDNEIHFDGRQQFTYAHLVKMTNNFEKIIGRGGFGNVYLGWLENGKRVAVKERSQASSQGTKEFLAEAQNLTRIHHRNLVSLVGFCMNGDHLVLVYDYMPQGSLTDHLRGTGALNKVLSWGNRLRIAVDAAQGLEYLHKGCNPPLIHRDVKSSNILLTEDLQAKIADFGLSRALHIDDQSYVSTQLVVGTLGYLDPEYPRNFKLSDKSDVYSFGIVLLEIITGQPPVALGSEESYIVQQVKRKIARGDIDDIVDKNLRGQWDSNSVWKVIDLAMKCCAENGSERPTMSTVLSQLKECLELEIAQTNESQYSENFGMSQASEFDLQQNITGFDVGPSAR